MSRFAVFFGTSQLDVPDRVVVPKTGYVLVESTESSKNLLCIAQYLVYGILCVAQQNHLGLQLSQGLILVKQQIADLGAGVILKELDFLHVARSGDVVLELCYHLGARVVVHADAGGESLVEAGRAD